MNTVVKPYLSPRLSCAFGVRGAGMAAVHTPREATATACGTIAMATVHRFTRVTRVSDSSRTPGDPGERATVRVRVVGHERSGQTLPFELAHQRQPASFARASAHPRFGCYWQCRPVSGRDRAAALNAGSNSGSGAYAAGMRTSMAGERPYVVNCTPSERRRMSQSTPSTTTHSRVEGPGGW